MNKSRLPLLITILIVVVGGIIALAIWHYEASFYKVTISTSSGVTTSVYEVVDGKNQSIKSVSGNTVLSLQNGDYCAKPTSNNYDQSAQCFVVDNANLSVSIDPDYSTNYLSSLLTISLVSQLQSVISAKYSAIIGNYTIQTGQLFGRGQWYGTTLTQIVAPSDRGDVYRVLLEKAGDTWQIIAFPQIVLSKYDYPKVPFTILTAVNKLIGDY